MRAGLACLVACAPAACGARTALDTTRSLSVDPDADVADASLPDAPELDAAPSDGAPNDAPMLAGCAWNAAFDSVSVIGELGAGAELRFSQDELTGYFYHATSATSDPGDVYVAQRGSLGAPFGAASLATDVNSPEFDADPFLSADGLSFYLNTDRPGSLGGSDIFVARRPTTTSTFSAAASVPNVNSASYDGTPYVTNDGSELWLASSRAGSIDLYRAHAQGDGFGPAEPVVELNQASSDENNPVLTADGLTVYYSSNSSGTATVLLAHRATMASSFGTPSPVQSISTTGNDYASWISPDGCRLYLTRGSPLGLYVATRH